MADDYWFGVIGLVCFAVGCLVEFFVGICCLPLRITGVLACFV